MMSSANNVRKRRCSSVPPEATPASRHRCSTAQDEDSLRVEKLLRSSRDLLSSSDLKKNGSGWKRSMRNVLKKTQLWLPAVSTLRKNKMSKSFGSKSFLLKLRRIERQCNKKEQLSLRMLLQLEEYERKQLDVLNLEDFPGTDTKFPKTPIQLWGTCVGKLEDIAAWNSKRRSQHKPHFQRKLHGDFKHILWNPTKDVRSRYHIKFECEPSHSLMPYIDKNEKFDYKLWKKSSELYLKYRNDVGFMSSCRFKKCSVCYPRTTSFSPMSNIPYVPFAYEPINYLSSCIPDPMNLNRNKKLGKETGPVQHKEKVVRIREEDISNDHLYGKWPPVAKVGEKEQVSLNDCNVPSSSEGTKTTLNLTQFPVNNTFSETSQQTVVGNFDSRTSHTSGVARPIPISNQAVNQTFYKRPQETVGKTFGSFVPHGSGETEPNSSSNQPISQTFYGSSQQTVGETFSSFVPYGLGETEPNLTPNQLVAKQTFDEAQRELISETFSSCVPHGSVGTEPSPTSNQLPVNQTFFNTPQQTVDGTFDSCTSHRSGVARPGSISNQLPVSQTFYEGPQQTAGRTFRVPRGSGETEPNSASCQSVNQIFYEDPQQTVGETFGSCVQHNSGETEPNRFANQVPGNQTFYEHQQQMVDGTFNSFVSHESRGAEPNPTSNQLPANQTFYEGPQQTADGTFNSFVSHGSGGSQPNPTSNQVPVHQTFHETSQQTETLDSRNSNGSGVAQPIPMEKE